MIYYVSVDGNDLAAGTKEAPFKTINHAAQVAVAGDTVRVFGGVYREWVNPLCGGTSEYNPIVYEAVEGEHPVIKGSEVVSDWEKVDGTIWKKELPNSFFGDFNPYAEKVDGDWLEQPYAEYYAHLGDVYINGVSMFEAKSYEDLLDNTPRTVWVQNEWRIDNEYIQHPELTVYKWFAEVTPETTTIFCNFREYNPNEEFIEINVRQSCFYPKSAGVNYIVLRGFEIAQAACPWTPPTSHQIGMVGPHWSKGWVIENNDLHDAKCSAVSLGKEEFTGHNLFTRFGRKSGHRHQLEAVFAAVQMGWSKETVGSHIVRNNEIHDCGQNGIVGHMGSSFCTIEHNHIYNIGIKHEFWGHEMGGIKFHAAIDTIIRNNNIHNCTLGTWCDWQTQGLRITGNIYHSNNRDLMVEVSHGPYVVDHNILLSRYSLDNWSQGGAYVHNLICGKTKDRPVLIRQTPYHFPHSTAVAGYSEIYGGDDRYYNNIFAGIYGNEDPNKAVFESGGLWQFAANCDGYSNPDEYKKLLWEKPKEQLPKYNKIPQPVWMKNNAYSGNAVVSVHEENGVAEAGVTVEIKENNGEWLLEINVPEKIANAVCEPVTTAILGEPRIAAMPFDAPDGSALDFSKDITGMEHGDVLNPGPVAGIKPGLQTIVVWKNNM